MASSTNDYPIAPSPSGADEMEDPFAQPESRILTWLQKAGDGHVRGAQSFVDGAIVAVSFLIAYLVRYDGSFSHPHVIQFLLWAPVVVFGRILFLRRGGVHHFLWRFVCLSDAITISRSMLWMSGGLLLLRWLYPPARPMAYWLRLPVGIIVPELLMSVAGILAIRGCSRIAQEHRDRTAGDTGVHRERVLLYGAGRAGVMLAHELSNQGGLEIMGFIDDDLRKRGSVIAGIRVLGNGDSLQALVRRRPVDEVFISIATATPSRLTGIISRCKAAQLKTKIVPTAEEIVSARVNISRVREVRIEDLLGRSSVVPADFGGQERAAYEGKRILVTGAGGSIGSELCRQLLLLEPSYLAILDKDENSIFELEHELKLRSPGIPIEPVIADIKLAGRIRDVFSEFQPQVVLHAAAHKHVPLMEKHPCEAVLNNVMGMKHVLDACKAVNVQRFVFISSDKAVNPTNVMGATKRVGEKLLSTYIAAGTMQAAAVRFGNVMGSRGSVIPLFKKQIEAGGPVTVTHPKILRFFMTIREAVQLVLCAGSLASRGETFLLDMGNPRSVLDLARQMIELAGFVPDKDIAIAITGLRPGEKMEEELACPGESMQRTHFEKVFEIPSAPFDHAAFLTGIETLIAAAYSGKREAVIQQLRAMDLGYKPSLALSPPALAAAIPAPSPEFGPPVFLPPQPQPQLFKHEAA